MTSGVVVWLVGLPSSGKTTLARAVRDRLRDQGEPALLLDGDEVRDALRPKPGYDDASRNAFYETLARLAALAARQDLVVLVSATAHARTFRDRARALAPAFIEVFVDTPLEECVRRDAKGLYASARAARTESKLPGAGVPFEAPLRPEVVVTMTDDGPAAVLAALERRAQRVGR